MHFTGRVPFVQHLQPFFFIILFFFSFIFFFILFPVRLGLPLLPGAAALHLQLRQAGLRRRRAAGTSNPSFFTASKGLRERHTTGEMHFPLLAFTLSSLAEATLRLGSRSGGLKPAQALALAPGRLGSHESGLRHNKPQES